MENCEEIKRQEHNSEALELMEHDYSENSFQIIIEFQGCEKMKEKMKEFIVKAKKIKSKIIYKMMRRIYDLLYRQRTYIPEKGVWVLTAVFPSNIEEDICGVTDVFKGNNKKVEDWIPIYTEYIKKSTHSRLAMFVEYISGLSDYRMVHDSVVKSVKEGKITVPDFFIFNEVKI